MSGVYPPGLVVERRARISPDGLYRYGLVRKWDHAAQPATGARRVGRDQRGTAPVTDGAFSPAARAAILEAGHGRCVGCGAPDPTTQHRRGRRMGGTSEAAIGHPSNGVPLCGDGVRGCHGWAEHNPTDAELLGWRLAPGADQLEAPWWDRVYGWRRWTADGFLTYVDEVEDLDRLEERTEALRRFRIARGI